MGLLDQWNKNKFSIYKSEEKTVLKLIESIGKWVEKIIKVLDGKTDLYGDHKGSWQGINKPTLSEEGMRAVVEKINEEDLPKINKDLANIIVDLNNKNKLTIDLSSPPQFLIGDSFNETFQNIINFLNENGGGIIWTPKQEFIFDSVTLCSNILIHGQGTFVKQESGQDKSLLFGENVKNLRIEGITFKHISSNNNCSLLKLQSIDVSNKIKNVKISNCNFIDEVNGKAHLLCVFGYYDNVRVEYSRFKGIANILCNFDHNNYNQSNDTPSYIIGNIFEGGYTGFATQGSGEGVGTIYVEKNSFKNQFVCALNLYHCNGFIVKDNEFRDISQSPFGNCDSGVIFLDLCNPTSGHKQSIFEGNTIYNCIGNAIYCEELMNTLIQNNIISGLSLRETPYKKTHSFGGVTSEHVSYGGKGILLTGGCIDNIIQNNKILDVADNGIELNRVIGVHEWYNITGNTIRNNEILSGNYCIALMEKGDNIKIKGNILKSKNNTDATNVGIIIDRVNTNSSNGYNYTYCQDNHIIAYTGIKKTYGYNRLCAVNNIIERNSGGSAISISNNQGYTSGNIDVVNNVIQ